MNEKLKRPVVEGVYVAIVKEQEDDIDVFDVYLINNREEELEQVLVTSKGYLKIEETNEEIKTDILRKSLGDIPAKSAVIIEPVMEDVLQLNNEFWVSFWIASEMYDKKYIFLAESVKEENMVVVPILECKGVMIG
ncbi:MAG: hypothetical protein M9897_00810 [Brumimicrobium sp.]|nr:hypothetical protein [Brumimicrobium sp.]